MIEECVLIPEQGKPAETVYFVLAQLERYGTGCSLVSGEEGKFFVGGVYSSRTRPQQKMTPDEASRQTEPVPFISASGIVYGPRPVSSSRGFAGKVSSGSLISAITVRGTVNRFFRVEPHFALNTASGKFGAKLMRVLIHFALTQLCLPCLRTN